MLVQGRLREWQQGDFLVRQGTGGLEESLSSPACPGGGGGQEQQPHPGALDSGDHPGLAQGQGHTVSHLQILLVVLGW